MGESRLPARLQRDRHPSFFRDFDDTGVFTPKLTGLPKQKGLRCRGHLHLQIEKAHRIYAREENLEGIRLGNCHPPRSSKGDWGVPVVWISDRDKRFVGGFWKGLFTALRTKLPYTAAYHPSADAQPERSNQTAEIWLRHWQNLHQDVDWNEGLAPMQASLNSSTNAAQLPQLVFAGFQVVVFLGPTPYLVP
ncbi:hypothetical protein PENPOL_c023G04681 [Penicillium polonicum]|uniref:Integrase catalytic domain-containing protein n=1 Tax=Penicillium polonicum TaxID=60169 RepID=A0A1V6N706_PENPO|nr:hypothetical protein PENPOL_c023G04681 [Penicillium polonicum]